MPRPLWALGPATAYLLGAPAALEIAFIPLTDLLVVQAKLAALPGPVPPRTLVAAQSAKLWVAPAAK